MGGGGSQSKSSSARAGGGSADEHKFESFVNGLWITDDRKVEAERQRKLATIVDNSRYKKSHNETIDFVKKQVGVDLNKYRTGDGSEPYMTTFWGKGPKVAFDFKGMSRGDWDKLMQLTTKPYGVTFEQGNAWIGYISRKKKK